MINIHATFCKCLSQSDQGPDFLGEKLQLVTSLGLLDHFLYIHFSSKLVLNDRQTFCPFPVRVQCGCLVNEVDFKDYNQRGDITDHMCQRR